MNHSKFLVFDLETTDKNPFNAEIIEGCFCITDDDFNIIDTHIMQSRVNDWSESAELVHGISYNKMMAFPDKTQAYEDLFKFLSQYKPYRVCCYSNPNSYIEESKTNLYAHYDNAVIKKELNVNYGSHVLFYFYFSDSVYSPYLEIKKLHKQGTINIAKHKTLSQFSLENVVLNTLGKSYNAHNALDDTKILIDLCRYIAKIKHEQKCNIMYNAIND